MVSKYSTFLLRWHSQVSWLRQTPFGDGIPDDEGGKKKKSLTFPVFKRKLMYGILQRTKRDRETSAQQNRRGTETETFLIPHVFCSFGFSKGKDVTHFFCPPHKKMFLARIFLVLFCFSQIPNALSEEEKGEKAGEVASQEIHDDLETEDTDFQKMFLSPLLPPKPRTALTFNVTLISVKKNRKELEEEEEEEGNEDEDLIDGEENVLEEKVPTKAPPTTAAPEDDNLSYILSRISALESAIHRLNVQFYGMDVKMTQMSQSLSTMRTKLSETEETVTTVSEMNSRNQKQIGQVEGCLKGKRFTRKCYLIFQHFETYAAAQQLCHNRGGNLAMPIDQQEYTALAQYVHDAFFPFNWPIWIGINDLRSEGMYLYENGHRVSFYNWYKDHLVPQPNGGTQENCVSITSHDGKWWDNDCTRRMYYVCEY